MNNCVATNNEKPFVLENNPDEEYFRKKKKMIKKNNGYCIGVPKKEEWKCPCKFFLEKQEEGWCGEGLYYKRFVPEDELPQPNAEHNIELKTGD